MPVKIQIIARRFGIKSEQYVKAMRADQQEAGLQMMKNEPKK